MRTFTTSVTFKCTSAGQADKLSSKLEELGYKKDEEYDALYPYITNQFGSDDTPLGKVGFITRVRGIVANSEEEFLAIAAMSEGDELYKDEYLYYSGYNLNCVTKSDNSLEGNKLPSTAYRKATLQEVQNHFSKNTNQTNMKSTDSLSEQYAINGFNSSHLFSNTSDSYPEFTFSEWKQLFLASKEKKIIGYKLIKPEYKEAVAIITDKYSNNWWKIHAESNLKESGYHFVADKGEFGVNGYLKTAGVLDLWFEPVYEVIKPKLPKIGSYDGMYDRERGIVKYGCVECSKETIYKLRDVLKELNGCHVEHKQTHITKENVEQIIKFIETK